ncbi:TOBE domain-containing protein, partial [Nocardioides sp.]|uniref:TOBE domain-containing protein n=1 Tax=Nocardioides sp. TaxID=35761 RepID=UPI00273743F0
DEGRVAQYGTPAEVSQRPRTDHVARLVGLNVLAARGGREGRLTSFSPTEVTVGLTEPGGSARLHWHGEILNVAPHGEALRLLVATSDGDDLIADVTPASATELGLGPGAAVWLSVKETALRVYDAGPG